jgi:hypothetical protein
MPSKKPTKESPTKETKKNADNELKDTELDVVAGGATTESLEEFDSRKRPGRVKSLHQTP